MLQQRHYIRLIQDNHLSNSQLAMLIFPRLQGDEHAVPVQDNQHPSFSLTVTSEQ
jgi:hypothetical protein